MRKGSLATLFTICFVGCMFGGIVSTLMSVYLPVAVKDLLGKVTDERLNDVSALINAVFIFGWTLGGVIWGVVCDRIGRTRSVTLSILFYGIFTLATAACPSWWLVMGCRFLSGVGVGGVLVTTNIQVSDSWTGKTRTVALGILSIAFPVGIFSAGLINYFLPGWREAFIIGIFPLLAAGAAMLYVKEPEGTRLEERVGRGFLAAEYRRNLWTGSLIFGTMLIGMWAIFSWLPTWVQSLSTSADAQQERGISMMLLGGGGLAGGFVSGWLAHAIGLRRTMRWCFVICFVMAFLLFKLNHTFSAMAYPEIAVLAFFFGVSQGALSAFIPELFPAKVCAAASGFCFNLGRLFTAAAVFFVGAMVSLMGGYGNTLFIFSCIFLIGWFATWSIRERATVQNSLYGTH